MRFRLEDKISIGSASLLTTFVNRNFVFQYVPNKRIAGCK